MSNPIMSVQEFASESRDEIIAFEKFWLDMHRQSPEAFPLSMHGGEWYEQFMAWLSTAPGMEEM